MVAREVSIRWLHAVKIHFIEQRERHSFPCGFSRCFVIIVHFLAACHKRQLNHSQFYFIWFSFSVFVVAFDVPFHAVTRLVG